MKLIVYLCLFLIFSFSANAISLGDLKKKLEETKNKVTKELVKPKEQKKSKEQEKSKETDVKDKFNGGCNTDYKYSFYQSTDQYVRVVGPERYFENSK